MIGRTIAHYQITEKIGEGGMGEVYRATDTKLKRQVALKILPESFAADPHRMGRFRREAEVLASLSHPNIAGIYGLEKEGDIHAIAMELVEGETLAARIKRGPIPLEETLQLALQIASALEAAHEKGIIHRDLKPANVVVSAEGQAKVLDFGLAKAAEQPVESPDLTQSPTLTMQATQAGLILGTAAYMAPEQAKGRPVDKRADNWAFGVVLFEMLTGGSVFSGDDITEVLAAVVMKDPDWDQLPPAVPATIQRLLRRCIRRDTRSRLRDIGDARISIEEILADPERESALAVPSTPPAWRSPLVWAVVVAAVVLAGVVAWFLKPLPEGVRIKYTISEDQFQPDEAPPVVSPDGKLLVYGVAGELRIRYLDSLESHPLPGSENAIFPFFSPDSRFLGYAQAGKLWKVELSTSAKSAVCDLPSATVEGSQTQTLRFRGATWGGNGLIVFGTIPGLYQVSERGGDPQLLLEPDSDAGEGWLESPSFLPDEKGILFVARASGPESIHLLVGDTRKLVLAQKDADLWTPVYAPSGHLIYRRVQSNRGLYAIPFSLSSLTTSGSPILIDAAGHSPSVSNNQILSYARGGTGSRRELVRADRAGQVTDSIGQAQSSLAQPALSPDGELVAVSSFEEGHADIWIHDFRRSKTRLTSSESNEWRPAWTTTGDQVVFERDGELWLGTLDNRAPERRLAIGAEPNLSADGRFLVFRRTAEETGSDLWYLEMGQEEDAKPFLTLHSNENDPQLSPDGRWLAYVSDQSGESEIYVKEFPSGQGLWPISNDGGSQPRWSPDGDELFYVQGRDLMAVPIQDSGGLRAGTPEKVLALPGFAIWGFAVGVGGESFILVRPAAGDGAPPALTIVHDWFSEFRESPASGR